MLGWSRWQVTGDGRRVTGDGCGGCVPRDITPAPFLANPHPILHFGHPIKDTVDIIHRANEGLSRQEEDRSYRALWGLFTSTVCPQPPHRGMMRITCDLPSVSHEWCHNPTLVHCGMLSHPPQASRAGFCNQSCHWWEQLKKMYQHAPCLLECKQKKTTVIEIHVIWLWYVNRWFLVVTLGCKTSGWDWLGFKTAVL